jgi:hypothetical protein
MNAKLYALSVALTEKLIRIWQWQPIELTTAVSLFSALVAQ